MRAIVINVHQALTWACCLSSLAHATDPLTTTFWEPVSAGLVVTPRVISSPAVGGYGDAKRVGSRVECVSECNRHPDCVSVAFNPISGDCYLQPDLSDAQTRPAHLGQAWAKEDSTCHTDDAPISNGVVEWDHTLTSLSGTVTCNEEFTKPTDDVRVTCIAGGSWLSAGECARQIMTNPPLSIFPLDVPFPVIDGWAVCVEGIPTNATRFAVNLMAGPRNMALHADFRTNYFGDKNRIVTNTRLKGAWGKGVRTQLDPFPVSVDIPFRLKVKATSSNTFEIYVDDILAVTIPQHPSMPASDVTGVDIYSYVNVTRVDLWCHN